jgi:hypothetical protein
MAEDIVPMKTFEVKEETSGQYTNKMFKFGDSLKEDRYIIAKIMDYRTGVPKKETSYNKNPDGTLKPWHMYRIEVVQPEGIGVCSSFVKAHEHFALNKYQTGDVVKIIGVTRTTSKGAKYKSIDVEKVELLLSESDETEIVLTLTELKNETGRYISDDEIKSMLAGFGFKKPEDFERIKSKLP